MKILFLCGSLEEGHDGVGDYTLRLAGELILLNHKIGILALNDKFINDQFEGSKLMEYDNSLAIFRLPSIWPAKKRFNQAKELIKNFQPDLISLQFVIFSFQSKGLPWGLANHLNDLGNKTPWHIMFHELWVGINSNTSVKYKLWGWVQQKIISNMIKRLKPTLIHANTRLYQAELNKKGFRTDYLPLFGNIPVFQKNQASFNKDSSQQSAKNVIRLIIFGNIHPDSPVAEFAKEIAGFAYEFHFNVSLIIVGRSASRQKQWAQAFHYEGLTAEILGEQPSEAISKILSSSTLGISTTPFALAEKSGTIAAMREHGLPVLCVTRNWIIHEMPMFEPPFGVFNYCKGNLKQLILNLGYYPCNFRADEIASQLAQALLVN